MGEWWGGELHGGGAAGERNGRVLPAWQGSRGTSASQLSGRGSHHCCRLFQTSKQPCAPVFDGACLPEEQQQAFHLSPQQRHQARQQRRQDDGPLEHGAHKAVVGSAICLPTRRGQDRTQAQQTVSRDAAAGVGRAMSRLA